METKDIEHLAHLSRIALSRDEAQRIASDITEILGYVSEIDAITGTQEDTKEVGPVHNVMREDGKPHEAGLYSETLLEAAPYRRGSFIEVKKILDTGE